MALARTWLWWVAASVTVMALPVSDLSKDSFPPPRYIEVHIQKDTGVTRVILSTELTFPSPVMFAFASLSPIVHSNALKHTTIITRSTSLRVNLKRTHNARVFRSTDTCTCQMQPFVLTEESVNQALEEARSVLGTLFDRSAGITGEVELATLDGPIVVLRLQGRFWHKRTDVLARISVYLQQRIPEVCGVEIEDPAQLDDNAE